MTHRGKIADKWHMWCAKSGAKNHVNADHCSSCGFSKSDSFGVRNKENVGKEQYL